MHSRSVIEKIIFGVLLALIFFAYVQKSAIASEDSQLGKTQRKPLIGINVDIDESPRQASVPSYYFEAIEKSGGIPIILPPMQPSDSKVVLEKLDGLVLIGGPDYPPSAYGAETESKTQVMPSMRSEFDLALVKEAIEISDLPILGICAGCQLLNIAEGGSLVQDIPSKFPQSKVIHGGSYDAKAGPRRHEVSFVKYSLLDKLYGKASLAVPTSHHQCLGEVASGMKVVAQTADGLPEAIEKEGQRFVVGVQWHPERDYEHNKALFAEFIKNASQHIYPLDAQPVAEKH